MGFAARPLTRDDQYTAVSAVSRAMDEAREGGVSFGLAHAVKINPGINVRAPLAQFARDRAIDLLLVRGKRPHRLLMRFVGMRNGGHGLFMRRFSGPHQFFKFFQWRMLVRGDRGDTSRKPLPKVTFFRAEVPGAAH